MDEALVRQEAAETLRALRGMEQRTRAASARYSPVPLLIFGGSALLAAPFGLLGSRLAMPIALGVALIAAVAVTSGYHRRQPVHAGPPERRSIGPSDVVVWVVIAFLAIAGLPMLFTIVTVDATMTTYLVFTAFAIVTGKRINNGALALSAAFALVAAAFAVLIDTDHWRAISAAFFGATFGIAALLMYIDRRNEA